MGRLTLLPTSKEQWHAIVKEAEEVNGDSLKDDIEFYLVSMLHHFMTQVHLASATVAEDYLSALQLPPYEQQKLLRKLGDTCLLLSGLYPERAIRRRVSLSYFVNLGKQAYSGASEVSSQESMSHLFAELDEQFVALMDVLHCLREMSGVEQQLSLLQAEELWRTTRSRHALKVLKEYTDGFIPILFHHHGSG